MAIYVSAHEAGLRQTECGQFGQQEQLRCSRIFGVENFLVRLVLTRLLYVCAYTQRFQQQCFLPACLFDSTHHKHETYNLFVTFTQPKIIARRIVFGTSV
jgi:hypothetical protein